MDDGPTPSVVVVSDGRIEAVGDHGLHDGPRDLETVHRRATVAMAGVAEAVADAHGGYRLAIRRGTKP